MWPFKSKHQRMLEEACERAEYSAKVKQACEGLTERDIQAVNAIQDGMGFWAPDTLTIIKIVRESKARRAEQERYDKMVAQLPDRVEGAGE